MASKHFSFPSRFALREISWLISLACGAACVQAQTTTSPAASVVVAAASGALKEVVVSGSRSEQDPDELPMSIDVINAADIEKRQILDIRDVAADLPNVNVARSPARFTIGTTTGREQNSGFNIRGLEGNRILMLIDGNRQPRSYAFPMESTIGRDYVDIGLIKRVEIVRGATSALYGSDGVGGLVNFITKEPSDYLAGGKTVGGSAGVTYSGDDKGLKAGATIARKINDSASWLVSASASRSSELRNMGTNDSANTDRTTPNPETDTGSALLAKVVLTPGGGQKHILTYEHVETTADYNLLSNLTKPPLVAASTVRSTANSTMQRDRIGWDGRWQLDAALADELRAVLSYQYARSVEYTFQGRFAPPDRTRNTDYAERSVQANLQAGKLLRMGGDSAQKITYGFDYATAQINNLQTGTTPPAGETYPVKRFPDTRETSAAVYAQDEIVLGPWSLTPGVRLDHFSIDAKQAGYTQPVASISGSAVSPKFAVMFKATPEWSVYGNYASGFKAPNAGQVNGFFSNPVQSYRSISNPNLKPEKSRNFEIGARGRMANVSLDVAAFTGRYTNFIEDFKQISGVFGNAGNPAVFQSVNIGNVTISGFEVKGKVDWGRVGAGEFSSPFSYGQTRGRDTQTNLALNTVNPSTFRVGLNYTTPVWSLGANVTQYSAKKREDVDLTPQANPFLPPAATVLDLTGQYRISKSLRLTAGIYNLTDQKYWKWSSVVGQAATSTTIDAFTQTGRYARVSLVADF